MKKFVGPGLFLAIVVCGIFIFSSGVLAQESVFLKVDSENLRLSPKGTVIGQLSKGVEMVVLERKDKWVKVAISGWIWEPSTTAKKDEALGPQSRAALIMLEYQTDADNVMKQLKAGGNFEELAKAKSVHPTAPRGGDLGFFHKGDFDEKFESAILGVAVGQISDVVKLDFNQKTYFCIFKRIQ